MKSFRILFEPGGARLDVLGVVEDFDATVQAALVNLGSEEGGDRMFSTRGTALLRKAVAGRLISPREALHEANFAAINTVFFLRQFGPASLDEKLQAIRPQVIKFDGRNITLALQMVSDQGRTVGSVTQIDTLP